MEFKRLYMRNFLAVGSDGVEILFNKYRGITLIKGSNQDVPGRSSNGSGKCLAPWTRITDAKSGVTRTIEEWHRFGGLKFVHGVSDNGKITNIMVKDVFQTGKKKLKRIVLDNGSQIDVSDTHPVITSCGIRTTSQLQPGQFVQIPCNATVIGKSKLTQSETIILAAMLAEGGITDCAYTFTNDDPEIVDMVDKALGDFGLRLQKQNKECGYSLNRLHDPKLTRKKIVEVIEAHGLKISDFAGNNTGRILRYETTLSYDSLIDIYDRYSVDNLNQLAREMFPQEWLRKWFKSYAIHGKLSKQKHIPDDVFSLTDDLLKIFVQVYWACDGYVADDNSREISLCSSAKHLIFEFRRILLRFGIVCRIRKKWIKKRFKTYLLETYGRRSKNRLCDLLDSMPLAFKRKRIIKIKQYYNTTRVNDNLDLIPPECYFSLLKQSCNHSDQSWSSIIRQVKTTYKLSDLEHQSISKETLTRFANVLNCENLRAIADGGVSWARVKRIFDLFGEHDTFDIEVDSNNHLYALDTIVTHNSTIIEGIFYGLTGKTLRKITGDAILHKSNSKQCRVEIEFDNVKIIRTLEPTAAKIFVDGVNKSVTGSLKETKKIIDEVVGINFDTLSNILIFGQHNIISFLDAEEREKRETIENLMNLREYNAYEEQARLMLREVRATFKSLTEQHQIHEGHHAEQLKVIQHQEQVLKEFIFTTRREITEIEHQIDDIPNLEELKEQWDTYNNEVCRQSKISEQIQSLSNRQMAKASLLREITESREKELFGRNILTAKLLNLQQKSPLLENRKNTLWNDTIVPIKREVELLKNSVKDLKPSSHWVDAITRTKHTITNSRESLSLVKNKISLDGKTCPTCYGKVDAENVKGVISVFEAEIENNTIELERCEKQYSNEVQDINDKIAKVFIDVAGLEGRITIETERQKQEYICAKEKLAQMLTDAEQNILCFDANIEQKYNVQISSLKSEYHCLEEERNKLIETQKTLSLRVPDIAVEEIGKLESKLESLRQVKAQKEHSLDNNPHINVVTSLKEALEKTLTSKSKVEAQIKEVETRIPYLDFWTLHLGKEGIKSFVIDQIIPTLNEQIEHWMGLIYQGTISVKFDKFFSVALVNNSTGNNMVFGQGSGGERRRIDLAIMLAFRQVMKLSVGKDPSMLFLDECAESLDEEGIFRLWDAIEDIAKESTVFVITHNASLLTLLNGQNTLEVVKKNGSMKLVA